MKVTNQTLKKAYIQLFALVSTVLVLTSCATGQTFQEYSEQQSPLSNNKTRLYIYRPESGASSVKPDIKVDGKLVGQLAVNGFLVLDTSSGAHTLTTSADARRASTFFVKKGVENYLRLVVKKGFTVNTVESSMVDPDIGSAEIAKTTYSGK